MPVRVETGERGDTVMCVSEGGDSGEGDTVMLCYRECERGV